MEHQKTASLESLWRCAYRSRQVTRMTRADMAALLRESHMRNVTQDVSGLLLHLDDNFLHYLEGPESVLRALAARIEKDPRHQVLGCLFMEPAPERLLPGQAMAYSDGGSPIPVDAAAQAVLNGVLKGPARLEASHIPSTPGQMRFWAMCAAALPGQACVPSRSP
ncbi:MAG: BLUF domain-containing protein [Rubrivivax sp.]|jgi:hypothetical protein